jgi:hypothetical protein
MLRQWWKRTFTHAARQPVNRASSGGETRWFRPRLEEVEPRILPAGTWTQLTNAALSPGVGTMVLLSDGTVIAQEADAQHWDRLTPDSKGDYVNGKWSRIATMAASRLYMATNVLTDGRVLCLGGEYSPPGQPRKDINTGEIYNPVTNTWTAMTPFPQSMFSDDPSAMLPNGDVLLGYIVGPQTYIYHPKTNTYTQTGTKLRNDQSDEETWVHLPDNSILSYDVFASIASGVPGHAQRYIPATGQWVDAGSVPVALTSNALGAELGPGLRLPDGRVFLVGANNNTVFYNPATNTWTTGPTLPANMGADDAPGAILPNGDLIFAADTSSPMNFTPPTQLFDLDFHTNTITRVPTPAALTTILNGNEGAFATRMLVLPNGQLLLSTSSFSQNRLWVYTPIGAPQSSWRPIVDLVVNNNNGTFTLTGRQLNGISEGSCYGDDVENSTNYPIVRITDSAGNVFYARSFNWSNTGVATGNTPVSVNFVLPSGLAPGPLTLVVIANGIPSLPFIGNLQMRAFYPLRYLFDATTQTYSGNITLVGGSATPNGTITFMVLFPALPQGVTLVNASGVNGGVPFIRVTATVHPNVVLRLRIVLRNPLNIPLTTFFIGFPVVITTGL